MKLFLYNPMKALRDFHHQYKVKKFIECDSEEERHSFRSMRCDLILEEAIEAIQAMRAGTREEVAKELADLLYVTYGAADLLDIPLTEVFDEVHRSNMSKLGLDGEPIIREDGKILKGPKYVPANLAGILG